MTMLDFFTDPVLRAPTIGCMLMCLTAALTGVMVFLRKQSLLGEALSHATYPGVIAGALFAAVVTPDDSDSLFVSGGVLVGAFISALLGLRLIHFLEKKVKVSSDAALCFVLSAFFGVGLTLASHVQFSHPQFYKQVQVYLYGQAATMTDLHILIYALLSLGVIGMIGLLYKELQVIALDRDYARSLGISVNWIETLTFWVIVLSVVIGIRSVGVILMSAMLIAPAVAARQYTHRLATMFGLAACFGLISGFFGNYLSVELTSDLQQIYPQARLALPTGPMIVVVAAGLCVLSLFLAPERGLILRLWRMLHFRYKCLSENLLKTIWRFGPDEHVTFRQITKYQEASSLYLHFIVRRLISLGWLVKAGNRKYVLTHDGYQRAARIVRLHRLWEVYLADYLGIGAEKVHYNAEEMEHIINPELEEALTRLLRDPKQDPHHQPIPPKEGTLDEEG